MPLLIVAILGLLFVLWTLYRPAWREHVRKRLRQRPFPAEWRRILQRRVPLFRQLPADLQRELKGHIQVFIAEKPFIGCAGQTIDDEVRVTIAAQACLLMLNRAKPHYFAELRQILVYPAGFVVDRAATEGGVLREGRRVLSGESWQAGQVILSWDDVLHGAAIPDDGHNVVIHEFAHQLDQENGSANGAPPLPGRRRYEVWSQAFQKAYDHLHIQLTLQLPTPIDAYAAQSPAEFFAVVSEVFFERPQDLSDEYPGVYQQLKDLYGVNPLSW